MTREDIIKEYGDILHSADSIIDNAPPLISISPKLDIALGGGVPEGSLFMMTGPEKIGKTILALQVCKNAQKVVVPEGEKRKIYYGNIEGRLKARDIRGVHGLDRNPELFEVIGSRKGNILTGEKYLSAFDKIIYNEPHSVVVIDSFSALAAEREIVGEIVDSDVAPMHKFVAKFTRRFANVLPINRVTLVGITHLMANIAFGAKKTKVEKTSNALKYAQDVKLWGTHKIPIKKGDTQIGQEAHWIVENTATDTPPGQKVTSIIKYGRGIWEEYELITVAKDFGIVEGAGWMTIPGVDKKIQGLVGAATYLEENPSAYSDLKSTVFEMVGLECG